MSPEVTPDAARSALVDWSTRRRAVAADRNPVLARAIEAGLGDMEIHTLTGISRTTIGQIRDPHGPLAIRETARHALTVKGVLPPDIWTARGDVRLSLPASTWRAPEPTPGDDPVWFEAEVAAPARERQERQEEIDRLNWAGVVLTVLAAAGITVTPSSEPEGRTVREHLAHPTEQYVLLSIDKEK